jgi:SAM-dependent methyltransferase
MSLPKYDRDYFEDGVRKGVSLYENFRWMPHISLPIANLIKKRYPGKRILDYGCAKGFIVYALRLLEVEAYGYDISKYAIKNCKSEVASFLYDQRTIIPEVDVIFIKDTFEHMTYDTIFEELKWIQSYCEEALAVIPLGEDGRYRIPEYGFDATHIITEDEEWWITMFRNAGFIVSEFYHHISGLKDNWVSHNPYGNGVFFLCTKS